MGFFDKKKTEWNKSDYDKEIKRLSDVIGEERTRAERTLKHAKEDNDRATVAVKHSHELAIEKIKKDHELQLAQRDFDMKNQKDAEILKYKAEADKAREDMMVLKKELEVTLKIVDINSDIVDVKEIINKLITALPKIDLTSLTVQSK